MDAGGLLDAVVERGSEGDLSAWAASGRKGLLALRQELTRSSGRRWPGVHPKGVVDALNQASAAIAAAHPADFLQVFADPQFDGNGFVLTGFGYVDDDRATERLIKATEAGWSSTRMDAAIGLGRRRSEPAIGALVLLLHDSDYLVRYHAVRSLGAVGDSRALAALRAIHDDQVRREVIEEAIASIEGRHFPPQAHDTGAIRRRR